MKRSMKLVGAAALSLLGLAAVGLAADGGTFGPGEGRMGRHGRDGFGPGLRALNLTDDQKAQLKDMREQQRQAMQPLIDQVRQLREQIKAALESEKPDAAAVGKLEIQAHAVREQLKAQHDKMREAFLNVLTPEQKAQWEKMRAEREQRMQQWRERRQERGPGKDEQ